jgi:hypothetical protein
LNAFTIDLSGCSIRFEWFQHRIERFTLPREGLVDYLSILADALVTTPVILSEVAGRV